MHTKASPPAITASHDHACPECGAWYPCDPLVCSGMTSQQCEGCFARYLAECMDSEAGALHGRAFVLVSLVAAGLVVGSFLWFLAG